MCDPAGAVILLRAPIRSHHCNDRCSEAKGDGLHDVFEPRPYRIADGSFGPPLSSDSVYGVDGLAPPEVPSEDRRDLPSALTTSRLASSLRRRSLRVGRVASAAPLPQPMLARSGSIPSRGTYSYEVK